MAYAVRNIHTKRVLEGGFATAEQAQGHVDRLNAKWSAQGLPVDDVEVFRVPPPDASRLVTYPFPLSDGSRAYLQLPADLTPDEASRLSAFIDSLVMEHAT